MTRKGARITVDLGDEDLVKAVKIAAVEQDRTVRDIVVEALTQWLGADRTESARKGKDRIESSSHDAPKGSDPDYKSMMENLNRYRGVGR